MDLMGNNGWLWVRWQQVYDGVIRDSWGLLYKQDELARIYAIYETPKGIKWFWTVPNFLDISNSPHGSEPTLALAAKAVHDELKKQGRI